MKIPLCLHEIVKSLMKLYNPHASDLTTVELRLSELIKTRGGSDKWIVRIIEQHAILWN